MTASVAVLMGGRSSEREISLASGGEVLKALLAGGYDVRAVEIGEDLEDVLEVLRPRPDVVFNALHGRFGEDGCIQGALEVLGIPYTHSGVLASALAMNKPMAKHLFAAEGIPCPAHLVVPGGGRPGPEAVPPTVIKPVGEGSSIGVRIVLEAGDVPARLPEGGALMIEDYVPGRELTVAVMGDRALGVTEIRPKGGFYDYAAKYTAGMSEHLLPAPVHGEIHDLAMDYAVRAHRVLGCRGVSRADFRYDDTGGEPGRLFLLEVNTQPGMTAISLVPESARHAGISFVELVSWMVEHASCDS